MGKYDILGYVTVQQLAVADPYAEENRRLVRPQACALGGHSVALMMSSANLSPGGIGTASSTLYAVLRDKGPQSPPEAF